MSKLLKPKETFDNGWNKLEMAQTNVPVLDTHPALGESQPISGSNQLADQIDLPAVELEKGASDGKSRQAMVRKMHASHDAAFATDRTVLPPSPNKPRVMRPFGK